MKIVHIDLTGTYNEEMNYQENLLPRINAEDGHEVVFIATCYRWENGVTVKTDPCDYVTKDNIRLIRVPYKKTLCSFLETKLRDVNGLYELLAELKPDVIMLHCVQTLSVKQIVRYVKEHKNVKLFADSHTDANNSAKNWVSKHILHKIIYQHCVDLIEPYTEKFLAISYDCKLFLMNVYGVPENRIEMFHLGGFVFSDEAYKSRKTKCRSELGISDDDILLVHSGKIDALKRTDELIKAFKKCKDSKLKLVIIGSIPDEMKSLLTEIEEDKRIRFLGWKSGEELLDYLCAADLYVQPGSQSATMQNAACCRCALALYPHESHKQLWQDKVFYVETAEDMTSLFHKVCENPVILEDKRKLSYSEAKETLDYRKLAARIYK